MVRRNVQPDTRLNWAAVADLARPGTLADPPRATCDLLADLHANPEARLWWLLTAWTSTSDDALTHEQSDSMYHEIMRLMGEPGGESWYRTWRQAHPDITMGVAR